MLTILPARPTISRARSQLNLGQTQWRNASPKHRKGIAEALVTVTTAAVGPTPSWLPEGDLRLALMAWSFNTAARTGEGQSADPPEGMQTALDWVARHSPTLSEVSDPIRLRNLVEATARRLDGTAASPSTAARKRSAFYSCLDYAVELGHLETNPLDRMKLKRSAPVQAVDRRVVVNPVQARSLLSAVAEAQPELEAYFACLYYAGLRPAEARFLRERDCLLPADGWGELVLVGSTPAVSRSWIDGGEPRDRPLKHRARTEMRRVPAPPELVQSLRTHIDRYKLGRAGRLFVARTGRAGVPLSPPYNTPVSMGAIYRAWQQARTVALTPDQVSSALARRPYDLRHAAVSLWLSAGVPAPQVAEWAGHSVNVLLRVYAKVVEGQYAESLERIEGRLSGPRPNPAGQETSTRIRREQP